MALSKQEQIPASLIVDHGGYGCPSEIFPSLYPWALPLLSTDNDYYGHSLYGPLSELIQKSLWFPWFRSILDANRVANNIKPDGGVAKTNLPNGLPKYKPRKKILSLRETKALHFEIWHKIMAVYDFQNIQPEQAKNNLKQLAKEFKITHQLPLPLIQKLVEKYLLPYFQYQEERIKNYKYYDTKLIVFGHTCNAVNPGVSTDDSGIKLRPIITLMNGGDKEGESGYCPPELIRFVREEIKKRLSGLNLEFPYRHELPIGVNDPFKGRSIEKFSPLILELLRKELPIIYLEVNRGLTHDPRNIHLVAEIIKIIVSKTTENLVSMS